MNKAVREKLSDKRLLFITAETYPSMIGGGRNAYYMAQFVKEHARKTTLLSLNFQNQLRTTEKLDGLSIKRIKYFNQTLLQRIRSFPRVLHETAQTIRQHDIIFFYGGFYPGFELLIWFANRLNKITVYRSSILESDDLETLYLNNTLLWPIRKRIYQGLDLYFAINKKFEERWDERLPRHLVFRSVQGINNKVFRTPQMNEKQILRKVNGISDSLPVILSCGFLVERKGYSLLFNALSQLNIKFLYLVAGSFNINIHHNVYKREEQEMQKLYYEGLQKLGGKIKFLGEVSKMEKIYPMADIFLHGAFREGTPNVLLEAMAVGLPIVFHRTEGLEPNLLVDNENALIYDNYNDIPKLVQHLIDTPLDAARLGHNASFTITENYTFEKVASELFTKLLIPSSE